MGILQSPSRQLYLIYTVVMGSNTSHNSLGKPLTNIIRVMLNIGCTTSPYRIFSTHFYHQNTYVKDQLMILPWYRQNPLFWKH